MSFSLKYFLENKLQLKSEMEDEMIKIQELKDRIVEIDGRLVQFDKEIEVFDRRAEEIRILNNTIRETSTRIEERTNEVNSIYNKLEHEFTETDEEVMQYKNDYMSQLQRLTEERDATLNEVKKLEQEREKCIGDLRALSSRLGGLRTQKQSHESRVRELSSHVGTLAVKYNLADFANRDTFSDRDTLTFVEEMEAALKRHNVQLTDLKRQHQVQDAKESERISTLQGQINTIQSNIRKSEHKIGANRREQQALQRKIRDQDIDEGAVQMLEETLKKDEHEFNVKRQNLDLDSENRKIEDIRSQIGELRQKIIRSEHEMKEREAERHISMKVTDLQTELAKVQDEMTSKFNEVKDRLVTYIGDHDITIDNVDEKFKKAMREKRDQITREASKMQATERSLSSLKGKIDLYREEVRKLRSQLETKEKRRVEVIPEGRNYDELMNEADEKTTELRADVSMTESLIKCYQNFVIRAKKDHECPVCERGLDDSELCNFISLQQDKLDKAPQHLDKKRQKLDEMELLMTQLRDLSPLLREIERIRTKDIPNVESKKSALELEYERETQALELQHDEVARLKGEDEHALLLQNDSEHVTRMRDTARRLQSQVQQEENKLNQLTANTDVSSPLSFDELRAQNEHNQQQIEILNSQLDRARDELQRKQSEISNMTTMISNKRNQLQQKLLMLEQSKRFHEQEQKLVKEIDEIEQEIREQQDKVPDIERQISEQRSKLQQLRKTHQTQETELYTQISKWQRDVNSVQVMSNEIRRYVNSGVESELQSSEDKVQKQELALERLVAEIQAKSEDAKNKSELIDKQDLIKRNIEDNLEYRIKKRDLDALISHLAKTEHQLGELTGGAQVDETDMETKKRRRQELANEKSHFLGMRAAHKKQLDKLKQELRDGKYKDVDQRHRAALIKVKTTEMSIDDLGKYHKALDKALMQYHASKMAEINEIIKELWQKVYRGQDIDTIEIRSETEDLSTTRRSYNYRVVMIKGDVALDMRGRCSAGQKVLACLIIRLALSEAFCIDCGLLALDEPTVNLDADNVQSLAQALQVIVTERRGQSNFQLVVITHDEEFVNILGRGYVDNYYRISKDPLDQSSTITKQTFVD